MEETLEEPKEVPAQEEMEQPETKLGVDFPFGRGEMETGIKFACDMDNESNGEGPFLAPILFKHVFRRRALTYCRHQHHRAPVHHWRG